MASPRAVLPFTALVGQEPMRTSLVLNAINAGIGGVLIRGERGTAKSTAVRALARLLPDIDVIEGCRYRCDPADPQRWCDECRARSARGEPMPVLRVPVRVVELPINASEDRVVGSIDTEAAIKRGERVFEPGVLADANRAILYVDEVNLLDDHLVDVLLDAAAMGRNIVEREGISFAHPSQFILVGTMNPEEGELRPQLLDRFGLCVDISGLLNVADRVRIMERDAQSQGDVTLMHSEFEETEDHLRDVMVKAQELLPFVDIPPQIRWFIALVCIDAGALGHRADIVVSSAARTLRAWREASLVIDAGGQHDAAAEVEALNVTPEDVIAAADLALAHRRRVTGDRSAPGQPSAGPAEKRERYEDLQKEAESAASDAPQTGEATDTASEQSSSEEGDSEGAVRGQERATEAVTRGTAEQLFEGSLFPVRKIALPRDRRTRNTTGKRNSARSRDKRGRYVRAMQTEHTTDIAFDATMRAAAPHQLRRRAEAGGVPGPALRLERQDLRQKVRRRRTGTLIVFVVDASASMDAEQRMQATKGAVLSLLRDAYVRRDKVALVVFSGRTARIALHPTSSIDLAENRLQRLAVGGTTPLTHGLVAGLKVIRTERLRDTSIYPLMVLISDGRGNISLFGEEPLVEAQRLCEQLSAEDIHVLVIDSARDHSARAQLPRIGRQRRTPLFGGYGFNACLDLAERAGGEYLGLYDLSQGAIVEGVEKSLRGR
ncbi:MAG: VWA domain-containing protein [Candidatus Dormibacteraeota bacterium]|nr:VWA domain-containing protein [Candidatus Dormibacteraeota bacterium]